MKRTVLFVFLVFLALTGMACSSAADLGGALLPEGIDDARVPAVDASGYVFISSNPPLPLPTSYFGQQSQPGALATPQPAQQLAMSKASIVAGPAIEAFGGTLTLASEAEAQLAQQLLQERMLSQPGTTWSKATADQLSVASGAGEWAELLKQTLDTGNLLPLNEHNPLAYQLITNLPTTPPSPPLGVGFLKLGPGTLQALAAKADMDVREMDSAFGFVRVDMVAFGIYAQRPVAVPATIDQSFLEQSGVGALIVSHSGYPGAIVSFMLSVIADRTSMETIKIGNTNARYRMIGDLHLVLKNKGSFLYAALSGDRAYAERLVLSAIGR